MLISGCTDSFDDINKDPDRPAEVPTENLFAWCLWHISYRFYDRWYMLDEPASFAGYVAKMSYIDEARYQFRPNIQDNSINYTYRALNNLRNVQRDGEENSLSNFTYAAKILEVKVMQMATDRWRDIPYSDAVKLPEGVVAPTYDKQEDIYPALLALAKEVADGLAEGGEGDISSGDLLFHGDMKKWQKFCNSLRLRMAIRISEVSPALAKQTVEEILGNPGKYPVMETNSDNAFFWWDGDDSNVYEPIGNAYRTRKTEFCAPDLLVDHMLDREDPRISVYFTPTPSSSIEGDPDYNDGKPLYRGYIIGAGSNPAAKNYSVWGYRYGQDLGGFSPYMRAAEVYFHIAEAAMLGYNTGGISAEDAYTKALSLSLEENEVDAADAAAYIAGAGKFAGTKQQIWYEEWVALFKQGMEGWSLYRRTGVPENHYIAPGRATKYSEHNVPPFRSPYPDTERNLNGANNAPFNAEVVDDFWGKQMWWDTRTGVY
ncbi:SusD/RagB family nutrient-binding outer membrane lipoprotein [Parabacteroides sp. PF5-9]|uniref:SusD/RagB family nutrient-binding outer membrane lipoprotein n=1 Tax=Parabacteroides sp. PF5-9 TaxID=1742404 RepID=UPI002473F144|nr:SusD/RagB family nutrient-binding outer membrane lipoprotein [Parabacteroides sp. PF5-9]